jgi:hypothetical protein
MLGVAAIFLLATGEVLRRSAHPGGDRPMPDGRLLGVLLLRQQASRRAGIREWPSEVG